MMTVAEAQIELEIAQALETVTADRVIRWLQARHEERCAVWVERAAAAIGRADRLKPK